MTNNKHGQYQIEHENNVRKVAPECMVLLKCDGSFPLFDPCKIAAFGAGVRHTIKGGTGSGDVNVEHFANIEEALGDGGFEVVSGAWLDAYEVAKAKSIEDYKQGVRDKFAAGQHVGFMELISAVPPEPVYDLDVVGDCAKTDTCIYVLTRNSGEGKDREPGAGDFELSACEIRDIKACAAAYKKFMLVLNVGGVVDLSPVLDVCDNVLLLGQLGMATGTAFVDVLRGASYPSGKLSTTWAKLGDYCREGDFGDADDTYYKEGIYVGYRYFETVGAECMFPFGYGLGYTTFKIDAGGSCDGSDGCEFKFDGSKFELVVDVKNTGSCAGKEVVQLYVRKPADKIDQPAKELVAFAKSSELEAGESERVVLTFDVDELATYIESDATNTLLAGEYVLMVGNSCTNTCICAKVQIKEDIMLEQLHDVLGDPGFVDYRPVACPTNSEPNDGLPCISVSSTDVILPKIEPATISDEAIKIASELSNEDLAYFCCGAYEGAKSNEMIGAASTTVCGAAGQSTSILADKGIKSIVMADGPAGLRLNRVCGRDDAGVFGLEDDVMQALFKEILPPAFISAITGQSSEQLQAAEAAEKERRAHAQVFEQNCTAIPIGTALAQSFNPSAVRACGDLVGAEMERFNVDLWLAPAMNIQRSVLCGRNFEYYSEDPLLTGKIAAAMVNGVQSHAGKGCTIKHFCCNNQETNRLNSNSHVSARGLRQIYLRGFEIAVKDSNPSSIMTSYNLLNGTHTSESAGLCETVLRDEWGFKNFIMTDWVIGVAELIASATSKKYAYAHSDDTINAGNDLFMPGCQADFDRLVSGSVAREQLIKCASRIIDYCLKLK